MLGPVMMATRLSFKSMSTSLGTKGLSWSNASTTGWRLSFR